MKEQKPLLVLSGGSKGIGKAVIEAFAGQGFNIATFSRNLELLKILKSEIESKYEVTVFIKNIAIEKKHEVNVFATEALEYFECSAPAVLVNNAGFFIPGQIQNEDDDVLEKTMATNLNGSYYLTRAFLPGMIKNNSGHIFTICSTASITAYTNGGSYCISKFALLGFNKVFREELKPFNIKVTSVLPGATYTSSWEASGIPEERFMKAEDIAKSIISAYNLSPSAVVEEILLRPMKGDI